MNVSLESVLVEGNRRDALKKTSVAVIIYFHVLHVLTAVMLEFQIILTYLFIFLCCKMLLSDNSFLIKIFALLENFVFV